MPPGVTHMQNLKQSTSYKQRVRTPRAGVGEMGHVGQREHFEGFTSSGNVRDRMVTAVNNSVLCICSRGRRPYKMVATRDHECVHWLDCGDHVDGHRGITLCA